MQDFATLSDGFEQGPMKYDANGLIDYDYYQMKGRRMQAWTMGSLLQQAGRHLSRDYLAGFRRLHSR